MQYLNARITAKAAVIVWNIFAKMAAAGLKANLIHG